MAGPAPAISVEANPANFRSCELGRHALIDSDMQLDGRDSRPRRRRRHKARIAELLFDGSGSPPTSEQEP
jgi:hypothetical protein